MAPGVKECESRSLARQFVQGNFIGRSTLLIRRDLLVQVGLFDRELIHLEDRECWLRLLAVARFAVVEEPLMWTRIDEEQDPHRGRWGYEAALDAIRLGDFDLGPSEQIPTGGGQALRRGTVATVARCRPPGGSRWASPGCQASLPACVVARRRDAAADPGRSAVSNPPKRAHSAPAQSTRAAPRQGPLQASWQDHTRIRLAILSSLLNDTRTRPRFLNDTGTLYPRRF